MIYHSIRFKVKPDVSDDQLEFCLEHLRKMGRTIPAVEIFCVGSDVGAEFTHGAMFAVKNIEAYEEYMMAPIHREMDDIGLPLAETMMSMDITDDEDPNIREKIRAVHQTRYAGDPELLKLVEDIPSYIGAGVQA